MLSVLFSLLLFVSVTLQLMQIDFERFEQLSGFDIYNSSLRVRKYNRTAVAINGTIELMVPLNESVMVTSEFFHSRLGNRQFNHYPAKFPTQNACEFLQSFYEEYSEYVGHIPNLPKKGECPIAPRTIHVLNELFPAKAVPPFFPPGLWKAQMAHTLNDVEIVRAEVIIKARNDIGI